MQHRTYSRREREEVSLDEESHMTSTGSAKAKIVGITENPVGTTGPGTKRHQSQWLDPASILLQSSQPSLSAEEGRILRRQFDLAEKSHRGVSWRVRRK
jgi:hypothetical protein